MEINRSLRLPKDQIFPVQCEKTGIALHHTVGATARSTFEYWLSTREMVGTAYIVDRDGTIFEIFDPRHWAWQFGLGWPDDQKAAMEKRFIGIEIASEGGLREAEGQLYCYDRVSPRTLKNRQDAYDNRESYREYRYFDKYEPAQIASVIELVNGLCEEHRVDRAIPSDHLGFYGERLTGFRGVVGHANLRLDKSDPSPDPEFWDRLIVGCRLARVSVDNDLDALFNQNIAELRKMKPAAGSMVKGLMYELQRAGRGTYVRLYGAAPDGHTVSYSMVRGDPGLVKRLGSALGFKNVTDEGLEVFSE